jgi:hypothetical protein
MARAGKSSWTYYPLVTLPRALDIVWCRFPTRETPSNPGPKPRLALVRSVYLNPTHTRARVEVTYGSSKLKADTRLLDLILANATDLAEMGLPQATRFDLDISVLLPWCEEFFEPSAGHRTPIIGHLNFTAVSQLETLKVMRRGRR